MKKYHPYQKKKKKLNELAYIEKILAKSPKDVELPTFLNMKIHVFRKTFLSKNFHNTLHLYEWGSFSTNIPCFLPSRTTFH